MVCDTDSDFTKDPGSVLPLFALDDLRDARSGSYAVDQDDGPGFKGRGESTVQKTSRVVASQTHPPRFLWTLPSLQTRKQPDRYKQCYLPRIQPLTCMC